MDFLQLLSIIGATIFMVFFFGLCIFIHELGHFLAAKWRGMHVVAFSIGFKKAWGKKINGVEYRIGWFPFGGYVEIPQVDSTGDAKDENGNVLPPVKPFDRMIAVFAGPFFNFLFGFALACVIWICGLPQDTTMLREIEVDEVSVESNEYKAGLRKGDIITHINGTPVNTTWNGVVREIITTIGEVALTVKKVDGKIVVIKYTPGVNKAVMPDEEIAYPFFLPRLPINLYPDKDSPAEKAGIQNGDKAILVNDKKVMSLEEFEEAIDNSNGKPVRLTVLRNKQNTVVEIVPIPTKVNGSDGNTLVGIRYNPANPEMKVMDVSKGYPAEKAGLLKDDILIKLNGKVFSSGEFPIMIRENGTKPVCITIKRGEKTFDVTLTPIFKRYYTIGVQYAYLSFPTPWQQFTDVMSLTYKSMRGLFVSLGNKLGLTEAKTTIQPRHMSGPIGIGRILYLSVYKGSLIQGLNLVVLITFNLGLLNLLPIPVLDGGHVMLAFLEIIFRRKVSVKLLQPITYAFVALLIFFMLFVTFYDTKRLINSFQPEKKTSLNLKKAPPQNDPAK